LFNNKNSQIDFIYSLYHANFFFKSEKLPQKYAKRENVSTVEANDSNIIYVGKKYTQPLPSFPL